MNRAAGRHAATRIAAIAVVALAVVMSTTTGPASSAAGNGNGDDTNAGDTQDHAVGTYTTTWVDTTRPTPAHGTTAELPSRTLRTVYVYPATGDPSAPPTADAAPDKTGGPYPLVVFGHGYTGSPEVYLGQIAALAARGFVVAAPAFPLTNGATPGGTDAGDVKHQPADVSFVITETLKAAKEPGSPLTGMIEPGEIAVGGHSLGAVTTMGFTNSCCRDKRVKALFAWSGNPNPIFEGKFDSANLPPTLFVHGTKDLSTSYNEMAEFFNRFKGRKAFLTLVDEDHASWAVSSTDDSSGEASTTTVDFLDAFLRDDTAAEKRLANAQDTDRYEFAVALEPGQRARARKLPEPKVNRRASATPTTGLQDGQEVTVKWSGYLPGRVVNIAQCSGDTNTACDVARAKILVKNPTGEGSVTLAVHTGPIGDGVCLPGKKAAKGACQIIVNDAGLTDPAATIRIPISFG